MSSLSSHPANPRARTVGTACSPFHRAPPVKQVDQEKDLDRHYLAGDAVGSLAEGALEDVHVVLDDRPPRAVWRLKPVVLSIPILKFFLLQDFSLDNFSQELMLFNI